MRHVLTLHPESQGAAIERIEVEAARSDDGELRLSYAITGDINRLRAPPQKTPARADNLWRHTCFEAFLRAPQEEMYYEFNFTPSTEWAAYRFKTYRDGMQTADEISAPKIELALAPDRLELGVSLTLRRLAAPIDTSWKLGFAAVIEEKNGAVSYWALKHPPGKPDFHHPDCFAARLAAVT